MKISKLIKTLQTFQKSSGDIEVFVADGTISCNHQHGEIEDIKFFKTYYETEKGDQEGILMGVEEPSDFEQDEQDEEWIEEET